MEARINHEKSTFLYYSVNTGGSGSGLGLDGPRWTATVLVTGQTESYHGPKDVCDQRR